MNEERPRYRDLVLTPWGWIGAVYSEQGLQGLVLPRESPREVESLLERSFGPTAASRPWKELRTQLGKWFEGGGGNLSLPLDVTAPGDFTARVWKETSRIPPGKTATYGEIAARAGKKGAARAVGQAMRRNPVPLVIPCHRVVGATGPGGFMGSRSPGLKTRMLALEAGGGRKRRPARRRGGLRR